MANPQLENGYTRIANQIVEAWARARLTGHEWQCMMFIVRKTYGWGKTKDRISLSQFALATGMSRRQAHRSLKGLSSKRMIAVVKNGDREPCTYQINKNFDTWIPVRTKSTSDVKNANRNVGKSVNNKRRKRKKFTPESVEHRLALLLQDLILERQPDFKLQNLQSWASHIDLAMRLDRRTPEKLEAVIRWCQAHHFWQKQILSTRKLREKYDQLYQQMVSSGNTEPDQKDGTGRELRYVDELAAEGKL